MSVSYLCNNINLDMKTYGHYLIILVLWILPGPAFGMDGSWLKGRLENSSGQAIPAAHILNPAKRTGTSSSQDGSFRIRASAGDAIVVSAMGFATDTLIVTPEHLKPDYALLLRLDVQVYELSGIEVNPLGSFAAFRHAFMNLRLEDEKPLINLPRIDIPPPATGTGLVIRGPITYLYEQFSRRGREMQKYQQVLYQEDLSERAGRILNQQLVAGVTGITDRAEAEAFLRFCNISHEFVLSSKEYEVIQALLACYERYLAEKSPY